MILWKKVRKYVYSERMIKRLREINNQKQEEEMGQDLDSDEEDDEEYEVRNKKNNKWYILYEEKPIMQLWDAFIHLCSVYTLFAVPFMYKFAFLNLTLILQICVFATFHLCEMVRVYSGYSILGRCGRKFL